MKRNDKKKKQGMSGKKIFGEFLLKKFSSGRLHLNGYVFKHR